MQAPPSKEGAGVVVIDISLYILKKELFGREKSWVIPAIEPGALESGRVGSGHLKKKKIESSGGGRCWGGNGPIYLISGKAGRAGSSKMGTEEGIERAS